MKKTATKKKAVTKKIEGYVFGQKRNWKKLQRGKPRYGNTATLQLVSAFLFGDPYMFTKTPSSIMWENLQHEFIVGFEDKHGNPKVDATAHGVCASIGWNAYKILIEILSTVIKKNPEDPNNMYLCTLHTADDGYDNYYTCPMSFIYTICDNLVRAKAKGWKTSSGYKKHRNFL